MIESVADLRLIKVAVVVLAVNCLTNTVSVAGSYIICNIIIF